MLKTANLLDSTLVDLKIEEVVNIIERYYATETTFKYKVSEEKFEEYLA